MKQAVIVLGLVAGLVTVGQDVAFAISPTGFMPQAEAAAAGFYNSMTGVWIPLLSFIALVALMANLYFHAVRISGRVTCLLVGVFAIGAGLPWLSGLTGGAIATSFTL